MMKQYSKRNYHSSSVGRVLSHVVKPIMKQRGFHDVDILADWEHIVGPQWAKMTSPHKLNFNPHTRRSGTLSILVAPGANVLLQHVEPQIIDRVNTHFGFEAVNRLKLIHGQVIKPQAVSKKPAPNGPLPEITGIEDPDLKLALQNLGQYVKMTQKGAK